MGAVVQGFDAWDAGRSGGGTKKDCGRRTPPPGLAVMTGVKGGDLGEGGESNLAKNARFGEARRGDAGIAGGAFAGRWRSGPAVQGDIWATLKAVWVWDRPARGAKLGIGGAVNGRSCGWVQGVGPVPGEGEMADQMLIQTVGQPGKTCSVDAATFLAMRAPVRAVLPR